MIKFRLAFEGALKMGGITTAALGFVTVYLMIVLWDYPPSFILRYDFGGIFIMAVFGFVTGFISDNSK